CPFRPLADVTPATEGSVICLISGNKVTPLESFATFPKLFGKSPTISGVVTVNVVDALETVQRGDVMVSGAPDTQLKIPPNCQRSTKRCTNVGALPRKSRPGPKGS